MTMLKQNLAIITDNAILHAKWLNTLSLMENTGARKISKCEHPILVNETILKHAAEEARHAYYLKKQISKIQPEACPTYAFEYLLAPITSYQYLHKLDAAASRYIKEVLNLDGFDLAFVSYLLVTYAIEVRADELYPVYQEMLTETHSKVNVKSIILEEEGHLEEMQRQLEEFSADWKTHADVIVTVEHQLFDEWMARLSKQLKRIQTAS